MLSRVTSCKVHPRYAWTLTLMVFAMLATTGKASYELFTFGAGVEDINGHWRQVEDDNGAHQFVRVASSSIMYEMFLHLDPKNLAQPGWWNIQRVHLKQDGNVGSYGDVVYGAARNTSDSPLPPASDWKVWSGVGAPAPKLQLLGSTNAITDCSDAPDEFMKHHCIDYFIDKFEQVAFIDDVIALSKVHANDQGHEGSHADAIHLTSNTTHGDALSLGAVCPDLGDWIRDIPDQEVEELRQLFFSTGIVSIKQFLKPHVYKRLRFELSQPMHSRFWQASFVGEDGKRAKLVARHPSNTADIEMNKRNQHLRRTRNKYAYSFTRTGSSDIPPQLRRYYRLLFSDMRSLLESTKLQRLLTRITDHDYELSVMFISRYTSGDFLDRHSDSVETRRIAFTMHLTQEWRLEYGGLLVFMDQRNWDRPIHVAVPEPNAFTFFDVSEEYRILPHCVTEVVAGLDKERIAVTGWMQFRGEKDKFSFPTDNQYLSD
eukprot:m.248746 g.248746  ORF g.248746 m.248746 type:complete len:487 (-) comp15420_c1_seq2:144-1604(-)